MKERGLLAKEARRIAAQHGVSTRQAYRYAAAGREPSTAVRVGADGRRYHIIQGIRGPRDHVQVRRIRYTIASVERRAGQHGITVDDMAELEVAIQRLNELAKAWRACFAEGNK